MQDEDVETDEDDGDADGTDDVQLGKRKAGADEAANAAEEPKKKKLETPADVAEEKAADAAVAAEGGDVQLGKRKEGEDEAPANGEQPPAKREETAADVAEEKAVDAAAPTAEAAA